MKTIQLLSLFGEIYDKFVAEARPETKKTNRGWIKYGAVAAAFLVAVGVVFALLFVRQPDVPAVDIAEAVCVEGQTLVGVTDKMETYLAQNNGVLTVSAQMGGYTVCEIGDYAFAGCKGLKSVVITSDITRVGFGAFEGCTSLENITVPFVGGGEQTDSVSLDFLLTDTSSLCEDNDLSATRGSHFGYIFGAETYEDNCDSVPPTLADVTVTGESGVREHAFYDCKNIKTVDLSFGAGIADNAFEGCECVFMLKMPGISDVVQLNALDNLSNLFYLLADNLTKAGTDEYKTFIFKNGALIDENYTFEGVGFLVGKAVDNRWAEDRYFSGKAVVWGNSGTVIPADGSVTLIGAYAFAESAVEQIVIPGNVGLADYAFSHCEKLTSVIIEEGITKIQGRNVFEECTSLFTVVLPQSLTDLGYFTFYNCHSLSEIDIPDGVTELKDGVFFGCGFERLVLPEDLTSIGCYAMGFCDKIVSLDIPDGVTYISIGAFSSMCSLKEVSLPQSLTAVAGHAFSGCTSLETVVVPDGVSRIGEYAFYGCSALKNITLPDSLTVISYYMFCLCTSLERITVPAGVTTIETYAFKACTSLTEVILPDSVTDIAATAFEDCTSLTNVDLPE